MSNCRRLHYKLSSETCVAKKKGLEVVVVHDFLNSLGDHPKILVNKLVHIVDFIAPVIICYCVVNMLTSS